MTSRRRFRWPLLAALVLAATPARAEDAAALLARAPLLALDGPLSPISAPLAVGGAGWGPFTRLCVRRVMLTPDGREVPVNQPSCLDVTEARQVGTAWHLTFTTDPLQNGLGVTFTLTRDAAGQVGPAEFRVPDGLDSPPPEMAGQLRALFRAMIRAHALEPFRIIPGQPFMIDLPPAEVEQGLRAEGGGFRCMAEGTGALGGRPVVRAECALHAAGELSPGRSLGMVAAGRFAIDLATGLVLRHGYASVTIAAPDPAVPALPMVLRGHSRQSLE